MTELAVITGASSGIGSATARRLARAGMDVALVARRLDRLEILADEIRALGRRACAIPADLADECARTAVYEEITHTFGPADVLVNNAGLGWYGFYDQMPWQTAHELLHVNVESVVHLSLLFLKKMRERGVGHIINIGSISGSLPSQGIALYGASKSFLDNFTTALHRELRGTRIHASVVRAGPVKTAFCETAAARENGLVLPTERMGVSAETVAENVWQLVQHPRRVIYIPRILGIAPWAELTFGWLIDALGPLLLRKKQSG